MTKDKVIAEGKIESLYVGIQDTTLSVQKDKIKVMWNGIVGDRHREHTYLAMARQQYLPKGTEMLNLRQISITSAEETQELAKKLDIDHIKPEELGSNIVVSGVENFSKVPFGSIIQFEERCVNLLLTGDNYPCIVIQQNIEKRVGKIDNFIQKAQHKRGQTAMVLRPGVLKPEMKFKIILPKEVQTGLGWK